MDRVSDTLKVGGERAALQDAARERGPEEAKSPSQTRGKRKRDVVRERSEILRHVVRKTVRISEDGKRRS